MELTEKQKIFCEEYIIDLNGTRAYKKAYPNCKKDDSARVNASKLLTKTNIKNYIEEKLNKLENNRVATAEEVLQYLTKGMRMELEEEVVVVEGTGEGCSEARIIKKKISIKDANKCAELLGKRYSLFTDKVELNGNIGVNIIDDIGQEEENE